MKTFSAKSHEVKREWLVVDATDKVLGRLATEIARRLRGKHKAEFTPHVDTGDFVIVITSYSIHYTKLYEVEFAKKLKSGKTFDLNDFKEQIGQMRKMGGITS